MNSDLPQTTKTSLTHDQKTSVLFANLIVQQTTMALMFLGKVPHPESGETIRDIEAARMFIDQLEMLAVKTKGNLDKREQALLQQSLTELRLTFVEAVEEKPSQPATSQPESSTRPAEGQAAAPAESLSAPTETESRKKFSKKY